MQQTAEFLLRAGYACGMSAGTIFAILHRELELVKKSVRRVPKLLSQDQMGRGMKTMAAFAEMVQDKGR